MHHFQSGFFAPSGVAGLHTPLLQTSRMSVFTFFFFFFLLLLESRSCTHLYFTPTEGRFSSFFYFWFLVFFLVLFASSGAAELTDLPGQPTNYHVRPFHSGVDVPTIDSKGLSQSGYSTLFLPTLPPHTSTCPQKYSGPSSAAAR